MFLALFFWAAVIGWAVLALVVLALLLWLSLTLVRLIPGKRLPAGAVVLVTGSSRGLGLEIAARFARDPIRLVLCSRKPDELEQARAQLLRDRPHLHAEDILLVPCDLAQRSECQRLVAETLDRFGRLDVLVNNAGIIEVGPVEAQTLDAFDQALQVNFLAALSTTWAALPFLRTQRAIDGSPTRARIVNIASIGGKLAVPHMLPYSAAKFALVGFGEGLHAELREHGIRVTTVCPGLMRTGGEAHAQFIGNVDAEKKWFNLAANFPLVSVSAPYAANRIYGAAMSNRAEITISPQAWLMARSAGLAPELTQFANAMVNRFILPKPPEGQ